MQMPPRSVESQTRISESDRPRPIRAITLDYWNTLVDDHGEEGPRKHYRYEAIRALCAAYGRELPHIELKAIYGRAGQQAMRWWAEEQRGYTTEQRIRWMLTEVDVDPAPDCEHLAAAVAAIDEALIEYPANLFPGAPELLAELASRVPLAIVSDTGFASGHGQNRLLELHRVLDHFRVTIYSADIGYPKPRPEPFHAALVALGVPPAEVLHVGDIEHTDVRGALAVGMRAVRLDLKQDGGPSEAEYVARSYEDLLAYLERSGLDGV
jgi:putative hydrolase of the HAD superfamily